MVIKTNRLTCVLHKASFVAKRITTVLRYKTTCDLYLYSILTSYLSHTVKVRLVFTVDASGETTIFVEPEPEIATQTRDLVKASGLRKYTNLLLGEESLSLESLFELIVLSNVSSSSLSLLLLSLFEPSLENEFLLLLKLSKLCFF